MREWLGEASVINISEEWRALEKEKRRKSVEIKEEDSHFAAVLLFYV